MVHLHYIINARRKDDYFLGKVGNAEKIQIFFDMQKDQNQ